MQQRKTCDQSATRNTPQILIHILSRLRVAFLVICSSNVLAVIGLRSLFLVVSDTIKDLQFLQQALALVLGFVGVKMTLAAILDIEVPVLLSLDFVVGTHFVGVLLSVLYPNPESESDGDGGDVDLDDDQLGDDGMKEQSSVDSLLV